MSHPAAATWPHTSIHLKARRHLQVGYGLKGDLSAIATALGQEGSNCIAVVQPQLEIGALHRLLALRHVPGIHKVLPMHQHTPNTIAHHSSNWGMLL